MVIKYILWGCLFFSPRICKSSAIDSFYCEAADLDKATKEDKEVEQVFAAWVLASMPIIKKLLFAQIWNLILMDS